MKQERNFLNRSNLMESTPLAVTPCGGHRVPSPAQPRAASHRDGRGRGQSDATLLTIGLLALSACSPNLSETNTDIVGSIAQLNAVNVPSSLTETLSDDTTEVTAQQSGDSSVVFALTFSEGITNLTTANLSVTSEQTTDGHADGANPLGTAVAVSSNSDNTIWSVTVSSFAENAEGTITLQLNEGTELQNAAGGVLRIGSETPVAIHEVDHISGEIATFALSTSDLWSREWRYNLTIDEELSLTGEDDDALFDGKDLALYGIPTDGTSSGQVRIHLPDAAFSVSGNGFNSFLSDKQFFINVQDIPNDYTQINLRFAPNARFEDTDGNVVVEPIWVFVLETTASLTTDETASLATRFDESDTVLVAKRLDSDGTSTLTETIDLADRDLTISATEGATNTYSLSISGLSSELLEATLSLSDDAAFTGESAVASLFPLRILNPLVDDTTDDGHVQVRVNGVSQSNSSAPSIIFPEQASYHSNYVRISFSDALTRGDLVGATTTTTTVSTTLAPESVTDSDGERITYSVTEEVTISSEFTVYLNGVAQDIANIWINGSNDTSDDTQQAQSDVIVIELENAIDEGQNPIIEVVYDSEGGLESFDSATDRLTTSNATLADFDSNYFLNNIGGQVGYDSVGFSGSFDAGNVTTTALPGTEDVRFTLSFADSVSITSTDFDVNGISDSDFGAIAISNSSGFRSVWTVTVRDIVDDLNDTLTLVFGDNVTTTIDSSTTTTTSISIDVRDALPIYVSGIAVATHTIDTEPASLTLTVGEAGQQDITAFERIFTITASDALVLEDNDDDIVSASTLLTADDLILQGTTLTGALASNFSDWTVAPLAFDNIIISEGSSSGGNSTYLVTVSDIPTEFRQIRLATSTSTTNLTLSDGSTRTVRSATFADSDGNQITDDLVSEWYDSRQLSPHSVVHSSSQIAVSFHENLIRGDLIGAETTYDRTVTTTVNELGNDGSYTLTTETETVTETVTSEFTITVDGQIVDILSISMGGGLDGATDQDNVLVFTLKTPMSAASTIRISFDAGGGLAVYDADSGNTPTTRLTTSDGVALPSFSSSEFLQLTDGAKTFVVGALETSSLVTEANPDLAFTQNIGLFVLDQHGAGGESSDGTGADGGDGGGDDDILAANLTGSNSRIVLGDGSGGGGTGAASGNSAGTGGAGGTGADTIGGTRHTDLLIGDGFAGAAGIVAATDVNPDGGDGGFGGGGRGTGDAITDPSGTDGTNGTLHSVVAGSTANTAGTNGTTATASALIDTADTGSPAANVLADFVNDLQPLTDALSATYKAAIDNDTTVAGGNDIINGGAGNDLLVGLGGADIFEFDLDAMEVGEVDRILDWNLDEDSLRFLTFIDDDGYDNTPYVTVAINPFAGAYASRVSVSDYIEEADTFNGVTLNSYREISFLTTAEKTVYIRLYAADGTTGIIGDGDPFAVRGTTVQDGLNGTHVVDMDGTAFATPGGMVALSDMVEVHFLDASGASGGAGIDGADGTGAAQDTTSSLSSKTNSLIVFGDGSGGGGGAHGTTAGVGGAGGGGADILIGGDADDILFGDGFAGTSGMVGANADGGSSGFGGGAGGDASGSGSAGTAGIAGLLSVSGAGSATLNTAVGGDAATLDMILARVDANGLNGAVGGGADVLNGGLGNDVLVGMGGADVFEIALIDGAFSDIDRILDYVVGVDKLRFMVLDPSSSTNALMAINPYDAAYAADFTITTVHNTVDAGLASLNLENQEVSYIEIVYHPSNAHRQIVRLYNAGYNFGDPVQGIGQRFTGDDFVLADGGSYLDDDGNLLYVSQSTAQAGFALSSVTEFRFLDQHGSAGDADSADGGAGGGSNDNDAIPADLGVSADPDVTIAASDTGVGASDSQIIFGDGSGGGGNAGSGDSAGQGGAAGGGNDRIYGGISSDILFGDGYAGADGTTFSGGNGGIGGGEGAGSGQGTFLTQFSVFDADNASTAGDTAPATFTITDDSSESEQLAPGQVLDDLSDFLLSGASVGHGDDVLNGHGGNDLLIGLGGEDIFEFDFFSMNNREVDRVLDFEDGVDKLRFLIREDLDKDRKPPMTTL
ncbi:MAG: hypothetical protein K0U36_03250, partial [Alphaproteobacteria bacterium]|nr:hypothetical protein [Alphaproteobacteria bacterium]